MRIAGDARRRQRLLVPLEPFCDGRRREIVGRHERDAPMALLEQMRDGGEGAANASASTASNRVADQMPVDEDDRQAARRASRRVDPDRSRWIDDEAADPRRRSADPPGLLLSAGAVAAREHAVAVVMQLVLDAMHDGGHVGHRDGGNQDAYDRDVCARS